MAKKIIMSAKPAGLSADDWVKSAEAAPQDAPANPPAPDAGTAEGRPLKRLTLDIDRELHVRIKAQCALRGTNMVDEIRKLLQEHFPA